jgi:hypothetical protein
MRKRGWAVFSLSLAIAVPVSGVKGLLADEVAWTAVAVGLALLALSLVPGHRLRPRRRRRLRLDQELGHLGRSILRFTHERDRRAPVDEPTSGFTLLHPRQASRERRVVRDYEQDTMYMYRTHFGPEVKRLVRAIPATHIGMNETRLLLGPHDITEVERVGRALIALSDDLRSRKRNRAA